MSNVYQEHNSNFSEEYQSNIQCTIIRITIVIVGNEFSCFGKVTQICSFFQLNVWCSWDFRISCSFFQLLHPYFFRYFKYILEITDIFEKLEIQYGGLLQYIVIIGARFSLNAQCELKCACSASWKLYSTLHIQNGQNCIQVDSRDIIRV